MSRLRSLGICLLLLLTLAVPAASAAQETARIVVEGSGSHAAVPDLARITVVITTRAPEPGPAAQENARLQNAVLEALEGRGVERDRLATVAYGVQPEWEWTDGERRLVGHVAEARIRITTEALDEVGGHVDAALEAGATGIEQIGFELSDPEAVRRTALAQAVRNARAAAEAMADAAEGSLGSLLDLSTRLESTPRPVERRALAMAAEGRQAETTVLPGEQTVTATVIGTWEFLPISSNR